MTFHAMTEHYEEITVCGKPALFTSIRIKRDTIPDGLYAYDVRHSRGEKCSSGILWLLRPAGQKYRIRGSPKESSATAASCNRERSNPEWSNRRIRFYTG